MKKSLTYFLMKIMKKSPVMKLKNDLLTLNKNLTKCMYSQNLKIPFQNPKLYNPWEPERQPEPKEPSQCIA